MFKLKDILFKLKNLRIKPKLSLAFLLVSLVPLLSVAFIVYVTADRALTRSTEDAGRALKKAATRQLQANRELKQAAIKNDFKRISDQIVSFSENLMVVEAMREFSTAFSRFEEETQLAPGDVQRMRTDLSAYYRNEFARQYRAANNNRQPHSDLLLQDLPTVSIAAQYAYISENIHPLGEKLQLDRANGEASYHALHQRIHPVVRSYLERFSYYDIFLVDIDTGYVVYSVFKEIDFATSLIDGPHAQSNFADAFRKARELRNPDEVILVDYQQYAPSYEAPAVLLPPPSSMAISALG